MIDNLIFDPMKQIWINLEFYLKYMNFLIFRDFLGFFLKFSECIINLFDLNLILFSHK